MHWNILDEGMVNIRVICDQKLQNLSACHWIPLSFVIKRGFGCGHLISNGICLRKQKLAGAVVFFNYILSICHFLKVGMNLVQLCIIDKMFEIIWLHLRRDSSASLQDWWTDMTAKSGVSNCKIVRDSRTWPFASSC